jgi:hypothetical protein
MTRTAQDYAENYNLFAEYIDPDATTSREEFEAMTEDERLALIEAVMKANSPSQESTMNATATITLSNAIIEAQSVTDIATRLANAPTENGADGCEAGELSRNQLLGQHAYHYCMDSDSPISADDFAKFPGDFSAYLTTKLSDFVRIAIEDLEYAAQYDEYPLSRADIAQLSESVALEHAVKLAKQQHAPKP